MTEKERKGMQRICNSQGSLSQLNHRPQTYPVQLQTFVALQQDNWINIWNTAPEYPNLALVSTCCWREFKDFDFLSFGMEYDEHVGMC